MNSLIFRAYDIRGVAATDLDDETVGRIARALGSMARDAGATTFGVARDARLSGPRVRDAVVAGLVATGLEVIDLGAVPTPLLYFAVHHLGLGGGVMITGSHNPPEYNGFKMMIGADTLHGDAIQTLRERAEAAAFATGDGAVRDHDIVPAYLERVLGDIQPGPRRLRVVVDGGNGIAGPTAMALYEQLGFDVVGQYIEPDGRFPNHHPDPTILETVEILAEAVRAHRADLAIGFDGDGDRIGVVDADGSVQWGDRLMILLSRALLAEVPGATIVGEVKCSKTLYDDIAAHGGTGIMWKTGHSLIKAKMKDAGALLAGEMSGHIFYKHRWYGFDDALYAGARLLEVLSHGDASISDRLADVPETFATEEIRAACPDDRKFDVVDRVVARLRTIGDVIDIDGARVTFDDGWGLVRASNTSPKLVLRAEATTPERRDEIRALIERLVAEESAR